MTEPKRGPFLPRRASRSALLCGLLGAMACSDPRATQGELGNVDFTYVCVDDSDYQCAYGEPNMPDFIGVGGRFDLSGDEVFSNDLDTGSPNIVELASDGFTWRREGYAAILIFEAFGEIEDFMHLKGANLVALHVEDEQRLLTTNITLMAGTTSTLLVAPMGRDAVPLAGAFTYGWQSADDTVVAASGTPSSNRVTLQGLREGTTNVRVSTMGLESEVTVVVTPNPDLPALPPDGSSVPLRDGGLLVDAAPPDAATLADAGRRGAGAAPGDAATDAAIPSRLDAGPADAGSGTRDTVDAASLLEAGAR